MSEDKPKRRRGRRPRAAIKEVGESKAKAKEEVHEDKVRLAKESAPKKKAKPVDEWYEWQGVKLLKKERVKSGSVYTSYVASKGDKGLGVFLERIKKEGSLR